MVAWSAFEAEAEEIAASGRAIWAEHGLVYLASIRADGSPRVHPVVPVLAEGRLCVAVASWSPKWRDLERDARCVLHALPGKRDDEFVLRCRASPAPNRRFAVTAAAEHVIHDDDRIFEFNIDQADLGYWEHVGQPGTYAVRYRWTPGSVTQLKP